MFFGLESASAIRALRPTVPDRAATWLTCVFLVALSVSCRASPWKASMLEADSGIATYVERERRETGETVPQGFAHPVVLPPDQIEGLLLGLRAADWGPLSGPSIENLFDVDEAARVAPMISRVLAKISPDERARFLLVRSRWSAPFAGIPGISAVAFFPKPGELNLAFDLLLDSMPGGDTDPRDVVFRADPLAMTAKEPELLVPEGARLRSGAPEGKLFSRWLVLETDSLPQIAKAALVARRRAAQPVFAPAGTAGTPIPAALPAEPSKPAALLDPEAEAIRKKLRNLDQLLQNGAITAEEHEKARREILAQSER